MTDAERDAIIERVNGDELTQALRAYAADMSAANLAVYSAALVNRCASMAASAVTHLDKKIDAALKELRDGSN